MMVTSRISELASIIAANTAEIDLYTASEALPSPSFDADSPPRLLFHPRVAAFRQAILEATDELHALMLGPVGILTPSHNALISLQAVYRFRFATSVPDGEEVSFAEMATTSGLPEHVVRRLVRQAAAHHIFREPHKGFVAHTAASHMLAMNPQMRQWVGMMTEEMWPAAAKTVDALAKWPDSQESVHTGYNLAHMTELTIFEKIAQHPQRAQRYAEAMSWFNTGPGLEPVHVLDNYPWESSRTGTVVDVGGGYGSVSIALAQRFSSIQCIVQDRAEVVREARIKLPVHLADRVSFIEHDFFEDQPVMNADVFFLRWILHDWSDTYAIRILRSLIPALKPGTRVLVNEHILPEPGTVPLYREKMLRNFDMSMLEIHNGKERDLSDWVQLFEDAHRSFKVVSVKQPVSSRLGIIEVVWDADGTLEKIKG